MENSPIQKRDNEGFMRSFARGLAVIEAMGRRTHTVTTVAGTTGLPRTVARRILLTLCELGFAVESEDRGFRLTPKVLNLGMTHLTALPFWDHAQGALANLCLEVRESCDVASLLGMGSRLPAYATAPGRTLLASVYLERSPNSFTRLST